NPSEAHTEHHLAATGKVTERRHARHGPPRGTSLPPRSLSVMALGYVRPARDTDVDDIARVQLATWQVAYPRFIPRFAIDAVRLDWLVGRWTEAVTAPPTSRHRVLVAIEQSGADATSDADPDPEGDTPPGVEHLVGFAAIGPADEAAAAPGESALGDDVAAITDQLVEPRWGRRG